MLGPKGLPGHGLVVVVAALCAFQPGVQCAAALHARHVVTRAGFASRLLRIAAGVELRQSFHLSLLVASVLQRSASVRAAYRRVAASWAVSGHRVLASATLWPNTSFQPTAYGSG